MSEGIDLHTTTGLAGGGGFFGMLKQVVGGGSLFMTEYTVKGAPGMVAFAAKVPDHIVPIEVGPQGYMLHRHGFLCGTHGVQVGVGFQQSLDAGIFGGAGMTLQSMPLPNLAHALIPYLPQGSKE